MIMDSTFQDSSCLFCKIAHGQMPESRILKDTDGIVIFEDHRPASKHHYLVVPKTHVKNPKQLKPNDIDLVEKLVSIGKEFLQEHGGNLDDSRIGFHWPPFNSIQHLHLHVMCPVREMSFFASAIYKPGTFWFVTSDWVIDRLKKQKSTEVL